MGRNHDHPLNPDECRRLLGRKDRAKVGHNTYLERDDHNSCWRVRYHGHAIVVVHDDGTMTLASAGHRTVTTKQRINWFLPPGCSVFQSRHVWYYAWPGGRIEFADGMRVGPNGSMWRPVWVSRDVVDLARAIKASGGYDRLPVLADALEEAGCDDPALLADCRGDGPHVREGWVVDLILGKL
jgi:hypothetical protein